MTLRSTKVVAVTTVTVTVGVSVSMSVTGGADTTVLIVVETVVIGVEVEVMVGAGPSMHKQAVLTKALASESRLLNIVARGSDVLDCISFVSVPVTK